MSSFADTYKSIGDDYYQTKVKFAETFAWLLSVVDENEDPEFHRSIRKAIQLLDVSAPPKRDIKSIATFGNNLERDIERQNNKFAGKITLAQKNYLHDPENPLTDLGQIQEIFIDAADKIETLVAKLANENRTAESAA